MPEIVDIETLRLSERAARFEGRDHGSSISCFVTRHPKGSGAQLHVHPYEETFIVQAGLARFTVGDDEVDVGPGHIVVVPPETPHKFTSAADEPLELIGIHPSDRVEQQDLPED